MDQKQILLIVSQVSEMSGPEDQNLFQIQSSIIILDPSL